MGRAKAITHPSMSFRGDISSFSLGDVFQNLATNQKTGTLRVQSRDVECYVLFRDGKAVSCSDNKNPSISAWLVEKEIVTAEQMDEAQKRYRRAKKKSLGEILKDMEVLSLEDYKSYLSTLVQESMYEALSLQEGTFEFLEGLEEDLPNREPLAAGISFQAQSLLMEGARRSDDWQNIRRHMPSESEIYLVPPASRAKLLSETEDEVTKQAIALLDGTRTLKKVIAKLPYTRFDACKAIAHLIMEKKLRPLDGAALPQVASREGDPKEVLATLKAILEREPNNRELLERAARLSTQCGNRDEAATLWKRLAISFLEEGILPNAEKCLEKSIELNPKDLAAWEKLQDAIARGGDTRRLESFSLRFARHFQKLGLPEVVRDHLSEALKRFPRHVDLQLAFAEARFKLGEQKPSVESLLALGEERKCAGDLANAERVFAGVLCLDKTNSRARALFDEIRSGATAKRREARRKALRSACVAACALLVMGFLCYDFYVRRELFAITRAVYAESKLEPSKERELISRLRALEAKRPFSFTTVHELDPLRAALERKAAAAKR